MLFRSLVLFSFQDAVSSACLRVFALSPDDLFIIAHVFQFVNAFASGGVFHICIQANLPPLFEGPRFHIRDLGPLLQIYVNNRL